MLRNLMVIAAAAALLGACQQSGAEADPPSPPPNTSRPTADTGQMCGGIAGIACRKPGDFCKTAPQAQCGAADQAGTCAPKPQVCTRIFQPVCGCDGRTYGNDCEAAAAGVSVSSAGECKAA
ncbi:Kazal-type serine protease inhibitor family protein [Phenylobacterium sp.]|uniref:Kazal-type serine protease inhibitor family protein n=1 Tax=Phenylobacterium sp. TaxID=1871053 RepID=UPI002F958D17